MAKGTVMDEIMILKYFETGPIEKVEVVFNIVREKMRERLSGRAEGGGESDERGSSTSRKRRARTNAEPTREEAPLQQTA
jgi:hypothetical protein